MEALITGATGFVGWHLAAGLRARGHSVRVLALPGEDTTRLERDHAVSVFRGDVRRPETLSAPMRGAGAVFHLAAAHGLWRPRQEYQDVNVTGTLNVCRAAMAAGVGRVVHVSTWAVYGMGLGRPLLEDSPIDPVPDAYTITKVEADQLVQRLVARERLPAVIVRPGLMFGPGDRVNFGRMADRLRAGKAVIIGSGRNALVYVYVADVVEGMILAAEREQAVGQIYNLSTDQPASQEEFWRAIAEEIGVPPPRLRVPYPLLYGLAFLAEQIVKLQRPGTQPLVTRLGVKLFGSDNRTSIDKARRDLGYAPKVGVRDGVRLAARWYLEQLGSAPARPPSAA